MRDEALSGASIAEFELALVVYVLILRLAALVAVHEVCACGHGHLILLLSLMWCDLVVSRGLTVDSENLTLVDLLIVVRDGSSLTWSWQVGSRLVLLVVVGGVCRHAADLPILSALALEDGTSCKATTSSLRLLQLDLVLHFSIAIEVVDRDRLLVDPQRPLRTIVAIYWSMHDQVLLRENLRFVQHSTLLKHGTVENMV